MNRLIFVPLAMIGLTLACSATAPRIPAAVATATQTTAPTQQTNRDNRTLARPPAAPVACIVTAQALNIRTCPGVGCAVIGWLTIGQNISVASVANGWAALPAGGWIRASFINCETTNEVKND